MSNDCIECYKTLSVKSRFTLFNELKRNHSRINISALAAMTHLTQPTITFHIDKLEKAGLVTRVRKGRDVYCQINKKCRHCSIFSSLPSIH